MLPDQVDSHQVFEHPCIKNRTASYGEYEVLGRTQVQQAEGSSRIRAQTGSHARNDATSGTAGLVWVVYFNTRIRGRK